MAAFDDIDYSYLGVEGLRGDRPVRVSNVARRRVSYVLPELNNTTRSFPAAPSSGRTEVKVITFHELYLLANSPGGAKLIHENLQIKDNEVRKALDLPTDPEFDYTVEDVRRIMVNGSKEEILDALDFGPVYIAQWMKSELATGDVKIGYDKIKLFEGLFRINLNNLRENFEFAATDPQIGAEYKAMKGVVSDSGRQRRAGQAEDTPSVEPANPGRQRRAEI